MHNKPSPSDLFAEFSAEALDRFLAGQSLPGEAERFHDYIAAVPGAADWIADFKRRRLSAETDFAQDLVTRTAYALVAERLGGFPGEYQAGVLVGARHNTIGIGHRGQPASKVFGVWTLRRWGWTAGLGAVVAGMLLLILRVPTSHVDTAHVYATTAQQQATLNLEDGSRVTLAPQTTLRLLRDGAHARTFVLDGGEAYFEVNHAAGTPFIVRSGAATAQVLGTAFLVRREAGDAHVRIAVADGKVRVTNAARVGMHGAGVTLTTGQVGDVTDSTTQVSATDNPTPGMERAPGRIMFRYTPLATVLQTVSQWYGYHFRYADSTLSKRSVSIIVSTRSSAEALATIERVLEVNLAVVGDTVTLVPRPPDSGRSAPRIRTYDVWTPTKEVGR